MPRPACTSNLIFGTVAILPCRSNGVHGQSRACSPGRASPPSHVATVLSQEPRETAVARAPPRFPDRPFPLPPASPCSSCST